MATLRCLLLVELLRFEDRNIGGLFLPPCAARPPAIHVRPPLPLPADCVQLATGISLTLYTPPDVDSDDPNIAVAGWVGGQRGRDAGDTWQRDCGANGGHGRMRPGSSASPAEGAPLHTHTLLPAALLS